MNTQETAVTGLRRQARKDLSDLGITIKRLNTMLTGYTIGNEEYLGRNGSDAIETDMYVSGWDKKGDEVVSHYVVDIKRQSLSQAIFKAGKKCRKAGIKPAFAVLSGKAIVMDLNEKTGQLNQKRFYLTEIVSADMLQGMGYVPIDGGRITYDKVNKKSYDRTATSPLMFFFKGHAYKDMNRKQKAAMKKVVKHS